jgi:tRNA nucleotidyltransferase (CCA-adding enzyme)
MDGDAGIQKVLEEIRDTLREQVAEYKRVEQQSLDLQRRANERQDQVGSLYKQYVAIVGAVAVGILALITFLYLR